MVSHPMGKCSEPASIIAGELRAAGFEDVEAIGRGGCGVVYRGTETGLDREVAIKVLTADIARYGQRFEWEQQAMARLTGHPNIVAVLHIGQTLSARPYLVMPFYRRGCTQARIQQLGTLPLAEVLRLGVKTAGALESAHYAGIVHRDVKPANILLTDYDEPALCDFGIAHVWSGSTPGRAYSGTPSFQAPEVLRGAPPDPASDVFGLGATMFCALSGRAPFERRAGEQVGAQLRRIVTDPVPNLHGRDVPDDIATLVEEAMSLDPRDRPSASELGQEIRRLQSRRGLAVDEMALRGASRCERPSARPPTRPSALRSGGRLPAMLAPFVGRHSELSQLRALLSSARLVTVTGIGGVGKTALAMQAAAELQPYFADGVWRIELADLQDGSLLIEVVAAALGLPDEIGRAPDDVVVDFLCEREALVVLDNCEHVVDMTARLVLALLEQCPRLSILATSREVLNVSGESLLPLAPLAYPEPSADINIRTLSGYDALDLFVERARAAVPGFALSERNAADLARICARLEGLPLALELAAARLRVMSTEQIVDGLSDRYALLTHGRRGAPTRQQTLASCVQWSFDLCTDSERVLWERLSVFGGSFEFAAALDICGEQLSAADLLETISSLVAKSILIRTECSGAARFKLLGTVRDFGWARIAGTEQSRRLQRRHIRWYHGLLLKARAEWFGARQVVWIGRLKYEMPNIRYALQAALSDSTTTALDMVVAMCGIWFGCSMFNEGQRWLDQALSATPEPTGQRMRALCARAMIANVALDVSTARRLSEEARRMLPSIGDPSAEGLIDGLDGYDSWLAGDIERARDCFERALASCSEPELRTACMVMIGGLVESSGDLRQATGWYERALALPESHGESIWRSKILMSAGRSQWRQGRPAAARHLLVESLRLCRAVDDSVSGGQCLELLGWCAVSLHRPREAAVLMGAASALTAGAGVSMKAFIPFVALHRDCKRRAETELGGAEFAAAWEEGAELDFDEAVGFAITAGDEDTGG